MLTFWAFFHCSFLYSSWHGMLFAWHWINVLFECMIALRSLTDALILVHMKLNNVCRERHTLFCIKILYLNIKQNWYSLKRFSYRHQQIIVRGEKIRIFKYYMMRWKSTLNIVYFFISVERKRKLFDRLSIARNNGIVRNLWKLRRCVIALLLESHRRCQSNTYQSNEIGLIIDSAFSVIVKIKDDLIFGSSVTACHRWWCVVGA